MKIKSGFVVRKVGGQYVAVAVGERSREFNGMIRLNETGKFIWEKLEKGAEKEDIILAMLDEYDATRETVENDVNTFIDALLKVQAIEE